MAQSNNVLLPALVTFDGQADFGDDVRHAVNSYNDRSPLSVSFAATARGHRAKMRSSLVRLETVGGRTETARSALGHFNGRAFFALALFCAGPLFCLTAAGPSDAKLGQNIADAAETLIGRIHETHYEHVTHVVQSDGIYDMDCSGFVDYLLKRVAPEQYADLPIETGHPRPRAASYFEFFHSLPGNPLAGWKSIDQLTDVRRGDIIAWALEASTQKPGDTGHVVIVAAPPVSTRAREYRVTVYDSSGIRHDADSRPEGTSGIGEGVITISVDDRGAPVGFRFNSHAHFHLETIAIGRIVD
jgi:hypothetical protein